MEKNLKIISVTNGSNWRWNFIGLVEKTETGVIVYNAQCIRIWGTDKGIGQLALEGPQERTMLDACGTVEVPAHAVEFELPVTNLKAWETVFQAADEAVAA